MSQNQFLNVIPPNQLAKPLHIQRLEQSLEMGPFMQFSQHALSQPLTNFFDSSNSENSEGEADKSFLGFGTTKEGKSSNSLSEDVDSANRRSCLWILEFSFVFCYWILFHHNFLTYFRASGR